MHRKLFCELSPLAYRISIKKSCALRALRDCVSGERFAAEGSLPASVLAELQAPLVDPRVYQIIANAHWSGVKGDPREEKQ